VRVTTALKRLIRLDGVNVTAVEFLAKTVVVTVALRRRRLVCPHCGHKTRFRYDTWPVPSRWRHLDLGIWRLDLRPRFVGCVARAMGWWWRRCPSPVPGPT
jgi:transposase